MHNFTSCFFSFTIIKKYLKQICKYICVNLTFNAADVVYESRYTQCLRNSSRLSVAVEINARMISIQQLVMLK